MDDAALTHGRPPDEDYFMEFRIELGSSAADVGAIDNAIRTLDPAATVDLDSVSATLRVAAALDAFDLVRLLEQAGLAVTRQQVRQLPSICCGGCGG
jgi:hypothetical protein